MFCKFCGAEIDDNSTFCPKCGNKLDDTVSNKTSSDLDALNHTVKGKNKLVAGLFGILLGDFGVHHFYLGHTGAGVASILFCWTGIPAIIGLVQGILILAESDEAFANRIE